MTSRAFSDSDSGLASESIARRPGTYSSLASRLLSTAVPSRDGLRRGYSLLELLTVLAIVAVLAGLAFTALHSIKGRANLTATSAAVSTALRKIKADSYGSGFTTYFVFNQQTGQYWGIEDDAGTFNLANFDPTNPAPTPMRLLVSNSLSTPVVVGPASGYPQTTLPQPFVLVHVNNACTFCQGSPKTNYGAIAFRGHDGVGFTGPNSSDGSFSIQSPNDSGGWTTSTIAIIGRTGAMETFSGSHS